MYLNFFLLAALFAVAMTQTPAPPANSRSRIVTNGPAKEGGGGTPAPAGGTTAAPDDEGKKGKKGGKKGGGGGGSCFHGDDVVVTDNGPMTMVDLLANKDEPRVLTRGADGQLEYSSVYYWIHARPDVETEYITLTTKSGHNLHITGKHLIYQTDCLGNSETVFADKVKIGKCLQISDNGNLLESKVISAEKENKKGIYAPITKNGNIVVNGVLASCFAEIENESVQKIIYSYMNYGHVFMKSVLPSSLVDLFFSNQNGQIVQIPEILSSFWDLSKSFFK